MPGAFSLSLPRSWLKSKDHRFNQPLQCSKHWKPDKNPQWIMLFGFYSIPSTLITPDIIKISSINYMCILYIYYITIYNYILFSKSMINQLFTELIFKTSICWVFDGLQADSPRGSLVQNITPSVVGGHVRFHKSEASKIWFQRAFRFIRMMFCGKTKRNI